MKLRVATCQFPVSADIGKNLEYVRRQLQQAKQRGAHVAHFSESALSGYAGVEFPSHAGYDWDALTAATEQVMELCKRLKIWLVLGSAHRLSGRNKPHNSLYIIDDRGKIVDRYDKMFCAGNPNGGLEDLAHYSPGSHFALFEINGVRCGTQICHEYRYPELYREYKRRGAQLVFHSFHAAASGARLRLMRAQVGERLRKLNPGATLPEITMAAGLHSSAANNYLWISAANNSARESCWASFMLRPDGVITGRLRRNTAGVLISRVDTSAEYYDSTRAWRERAMRGVFHSGTPPRDPRSRARRRL